MSPLIEAVGISKRFGRDWVLRDLSIELRRGEVVALLGPNGVGKTTLLRVLAGLVRPTKGEMSLRGRVGMIANPPAFHRHFTGEENLSYALRLEGRRADPEGVAQALRAVGLPPGKPVGSYSSGMKKRLAMARLSLLSPEIWLLDEPEAALDAAGRELLQGLVASARGERGVLLATHDRGWLGVADRAVELSQA